MLCKPANATLSTMSPPRATSAEPIPAQPPEQIAAAITSFLEAHAVCAVLEDGKVIFDLNSAKYSIATDHNRCTLHLWSEERNMVRRIVSTTQRDGVLRLATQRFGQDRNEAAGVDARPQPAHADDARRRSRTICDDVGARASTHLRGLEARGLSLRDGPREELRPSLRSRFAGEGQAGLGRGRRQ